jgi:hypothetical protein
MHYRWNRQCQSHTQGLLILSVDSPFSRAIGLSVFWESISKIFNLTPHPPPPRGFFSRGLGNFDFHHKVLEGLRMILQVEFSPLSLTSHEVWGEWEKEERMTSALCVLERVPHFSATPWRAGAPANRRACNSAYNLLNLSVPAPRWLWEMSQHL